MFDECDAARCYDSQMGNMSWWSHLCVITRSNTARKNAGNHMTRLCVFRTRNLNVPKESEKSSSDIPVLTVSLFINRDQRLWNIAYKSMFRLTR